MNTMLYKYPGPYQLQDGGYDYKVFLDEDVPQAIKDGWYRVSTDARKAHESKDNAPPTRDELEAKAAELKIKFDGRTSDKRLSEQIAEAL